MIFREIFRFEFAYQIRRVWPWLNGAALVVFAFLMTRDGSLAEALHDDFFLNSPFAIAKTTVTGSLIWLLLAAVVAGDAAARDVTTRMYPLTYTTPVSKAAYLGGRFLAALALNALILLAVQAGILLAVYAPGVDAALIGPFRPAAYLTAYAFIALPNAIVATALQFALATRTGRPMTSFLGSVLLFFMAYVVGLFLVLQGRQAVANLLDPIGVHFILSELSFLWTPTEKRWRLITPEGIVLTNRLLWLGIAVATLAATYLGFRFAHRTESPWFGRLARRRDRQAPPTAATDTAGRTPLAIPQVRRTFGLATGLHQTRAIARDSFLTLATSWAGLGMLAGIPLLTIAVVLDQMELNGVPLVPTTARVLNELTAPLTGPTSRWVIVPLLIVFFAGSLVWRERDAGLGEITDALPGSEWAPFLGKFLGLGLLLALLMGLLMMAGIVAQALLGYRDFAFGLYLRVLFGLQLPEYLLFALLALVLYTLVGQKYVAHLVAVGAYVAIALAAIFGIEHNLLIYGSDPGWSYTEMRGFDATLGPWLWFKLYWAAWALLLAVAARLLWVRGREQGLGARLRRARRRLPRPTAWTAAVAAGLILVLGGFIFYNTNVLNRYRTASDIVERSAEYERRYGQYAGLPQPRLTGATMRVDIYPARGMVEIGGTYRLANSGATPIDTIHIATVPGVETGALTFDRAATIVLADDDLGHRVYALGSPLQPGDTVQFDVTVRIAPRGFSNSGGNAAIAANGTYFTNREWLPAIGYQRERELTSAAERRAHGLAPRPLIAPLDDIAARNDRGGALAFEAVVGTDENQIAVAPGALRRTWAEGGRRYFHYATSAPIGNEYAFFSADYALHEARWVDPAGTGQAVAIRIFHHPGHTAHLDRMVRSIRASLDYYTGQFGPYQYDHLSVVERPGGGASLHAESSMITYEEGFALWDPEDEPGSLDLPFAVMAHEMAHQWTVPYAFVEGAPVLSESVAWYYGMKAVEHSRGPEQLQLLRRFMRQPNPYPPIRRGEPLLRGLDPYLSYRRGPFALYAVSEYVGEERVNAALRRLLEQHRPAGAPLATTRDLYRELQAVTPDTLQYLLHDLFETNTYWELVTERATAEQNPAGTWRVTLEVRARKIVADEAGVEAEVPLDDWVMVGVAASTEAGDAPGAPLVTERQRIRSGTQTLVVTVPQRPASVGLDPEHLLIDLEPDDNVAAVEPTR